MYIIPHSHNRIIAESHNVHPATSIRTSFSLLVPLLVPLVKEQVILAHSSSLTLPFRLRLLRKCLLGDLRMAEFLKADNEDVLCRAASVKEMQTAALPPGAILNR